MNRRVFIKTSAAAATVPFFPTLPYFRVQDGDFRSLRRNTGIYTERGGTIGWLVSDGAVVVVDTQFPDSAARCRSGILERSSRPIDLLINTHHHGDHTAGNGVLGEGVARILAHQQVPVLQQKQAASRDALDAQVYANVTFQSAYAEAIGDENIHLKWYGNAHTGGDAVIHFEKANVAHVGDLVFNRMPCFIDLPGGASSAGWIDVLEKIHADYSDDTLFIFGHGNPDYGVTGSRADLLVMRDFLTALRAYVAKGRAAGKSRDELQIDRLPGFENHYVDSWADGIQLDIATVYDEMEQASE